MREDILDQFLSRVIDGLKSDAANKQQKIPVSSFRKQVNDNGAALYAADYFKYLITGRGPGKFPPPDKMLAWVQSNPDVLARARQVYNNLSERSLAYLIGRKISREGTDIHTGKRKGIDLIGVLEKETPTLMSQLAKNEAINMQTVIHSAIRK